MMKKFCTLVIGGRGFIGSHLVSALLKSGHRVRSFDRQGIGSKGGGSVLDSNLEQVDGDFVVAADLARAMDGCEICYHLVSTTTPTSSNDNFIHDVDTNILATIRLLDQAVKAGVKKVVFASSGGTVYGVPEQVPIPESHATDPICSYGIVKLTIEKYLDLFYKLHRLEYSILRISNPYGEGQPANKGQGAVAVFLNKAMQLEEIEIWGDGSVIRDYIHIGDVVSALIAASKYVGNVRIFNIGAGRGLTLNYVLDAIDNVVEQPTRRLYLPGRRFDVPSNVLSVERAYQELGWTPQVEFEDGLKYFFNYLKNEPMGI